MPRARISYGLLTSQDQGGGDSKQGLPPSVGLGNFSMRINRRKAGHYASSATSSPIIVTSQNCGSTTTIQLAAIASKGEFGNFWTLNDNTFTLNNCQILQIDNESLFIQQNKLFINNGVITISTNGELACVLLEEATDVLPVQEHNTTLGYIENNGIININETGALFIDNGSINNEGTINNQGIFNVATATPCSGLYIGNGTVTGNNRINECGG